MIAYNREWLNNLYVRNEADEAFDKNFITKEEQQQIHEKYPVEFYSPNIFIRIGLFVLTIVILLFSLGLIILLLLSSNENAIGGVAIFFGCMGFLALEFMIRTKKHYQSGVDDALLWGAALCLFCGISLPNNFGEFANSIIIFIISGLAVLRYADKLMSVICYLSLMGILFYGFTGISDSMKTIIPFIIMATSLIVYFVALRAKKDLLHYRNCLLMVEIAALICLYVAGNYYTVRELSNSMFDLNLEAGESIAFGWVFWIFTILIPVLYLAIGIRKKDAVLLRTGLILLAAIVFTVRYYHSLLPVEIIMTISGIVLLVLAYGLMKWLHKPVQGFTSREISSGNTMDKLQIESLLLAQTFKPGAAIDTQKFGGGDFGGGGASGDY